MKPWKKNKAGNWILEGKGFFVSYQDFQGVKDEMRKVLGKESAALKDIKPETALCVRLKKQEKMTLGGKFLGNKKHKYLILCGDHREQFGKLVPKGLKACLDYFNAHQDEVGFWSEDGGFVDKILPR